MKSMIKYDKYPRIYPLARGKFICYDFGWGLIARRGYCKEGFCRGNSSLENLGAPSRGDPRIGV